MADIQQSTLDSSVSPPRILASHSDRQFRNDLYDATSPDGLASDGEPASLRIGQPVSSATELLLQDSVLFAEILDDRILLTADSSASILLDQHYSQQLPVGWQTA
ncbi:MAG: hypothetical protein GY722_21855 [bacterium]|nr:hypothetical protein [bacterium]